MLLDVSDRYVLDASALLCLLNGETGHGRVAEVLTASVMSAVNLSEVVAKLMELNTDIRTVVELLDPLRLTILPFDEVAAMAAGVLRMQTRAAGLSFGDRACLALAMDHGAVALTADRAWKAVADRLAINIELLR